MARVSRTVTWVSREPMASLRESLEVKKVGKVRVSKPTARNRKLMRNKEMKFKTRILTAKKEANNDDHSDKRRGANSVASRDVRLKV